jgi:hypothetical protein
MRLEFGPTMALRIVPENSVEAMALRYWEKEYREHGDKLLEVVTDIPIMLPHTKTE